MASFNYHKPVTYFGKFIAKFVILMHCENRYSGIGFQSTNAVYKQKILYTSHLGIWKCTENPEKIRKKPGGNCRKDLLLNSA